MQTYLNQRKVLFKKNANVIQDPTVNQHQHMIFMLSLLQTYLNQFRIMLTNVKLYLSDCFVTSLQHQRSLHNTS